MEIFSVTRGTWVFRNGELILKGGPQDIRPVSCRSHLSAPTVVRDSLPDLVSQIDGRPYDSKSALRKHYKAHGAIELGNDAPVAPTAPPRPAVTPGEVAQAYHKVKQGYKPKLPDPAELSFD